MKYFNLKKENKTYSNELSFKSGFTIIETMVAITIIVLAITGPLAIVARSLSTTYYARDQVTAYYLAQEAIEYVRNVRDTNSLQYSASNINSVATRNPGWLLGLSACTSQYGCTIDAHASVGNAISKCSSQVCPVLLFDNSQNSGGYGYSTGTPSPFTRKITITCIPADPGDTLSQCSDVDEAQVSVLMSWKTGGLAKSFTLKENITNWQNS